MKRCQSVSRCTTCTEYARIALTERLKIVPVPFAVLASERETNNFAPKHQNRTPFANVFLFISIWTKKKIETQKNEIGRPSSNVATYLVTKHKRHMPSYSSHNMLWGSLAIVSFASEPMWAKRSAMLHERRALWLSFSRFRVRARLPAIDNRQTENKNENKETKQSKRNAITIRAIFVNVRRQHLFSSMFAGCTK